jgi:hypothetical protein
MESDGIQEQSNRQTAKYVLTGGYSAEVVNDISTYKCIFYMARFSPAILLVVSTVPTFDISLSASFHVHACICISNCLEDVLI